MVKKIRVNNKWRLIMVNMTEKRQLWKYVSMNIKGADEENTSFGLPAKMLDRKSGFGSKVATQEVNTDKDPVLAPIRKRKFLENRLQFD